MPRCLRLTALPILLLVFVAPIAVGYKDQDVMRKMPRSKAQAKKTIPVKCKQELKKERNEDITTKAMLRLMKQVKTTMIAGKEEITTITCLLLQMVE